MGARLEQEERGRRRRARARFVSPAPDDDVLVKRLCGVRFIVERAARDFDYAEWF